MTEKIYFQWQNKHPRDTIYPLRDMKLRHFLLYYHEIDLWEKYKDKTIDDLPQEKAEFLTAQKRAVTAAYKAESNLRSYFMDTGDGPEEQDGKKTKFARLLIDIQNDIKDDSARDELEWLRDSFVSLHSNFNVYFQKFEQEKDDRARDRLADQRKLNIYAGCMSQRWQPWRRRMRGRSS